MEDTVFVKFFWSFHFDFFDPGNITKQTSLNCPAPTNQNAQYTVELDNFSRFATFYQALVSLTCAASKRRELQPYDDSQI